MEDIDFDIEISLSYILEDGDVEMEIEETEIERKICDVCSKTFKTENNLARHKAKFHSGESETSDKLMEDILDVVSLCVGDIGKDECLDENTRKAIQNYSVDNLQESFLLECVKIYKNIHDTGDAGCFYATFYSSIIANAVLYFPGLPFPACTTLSMKIADKLLARCQPPKELSTVLGNVKELSPMELGGLQYLPGYIIKNLIGKAKRYTQKCDKSIVEIFALFLDENPTNQKLITTKNRGGLTAVNEDGQQLFVEIERRFRQLVSSKPLSTLHSYDEIEHLLTDNKIVGYFCAVLNAENTIFKEEVKVQALEMILDLYC